MLIPGFASPDPSDTDNLDGTRVATWDFSTTENYTLSDTEIYGGNAILSKIQNKWSMVNGTDYGIGSSTNLSISADGLIMLNTTDDKQLIENGYFDNPPVGSLADNWESMSLGTSALNSEVRNQTGGKDDDGYCWRNYYADLNPGQSFDRYVWLNQTINITSIPLAVNISAFHLFDNNSYIISPGSLAEIYITNLNTNQSFNLSSSGWVNSTYANYTSLGSEDCSVFNQTGLYNITLFTLTDSSGEKAHTSPSAAGIENFWDNASLLFTAYKPEGDYVSDVYDAGDHAMWTNMTWEEDRPANTNISFRIRTGDTPFPTDSIWSNWSTPMTDPTNAVIDRPWSRYIQYMFNVSTDITNTAPSIRNVTINYEQYEPMGYIETENFKPANITNWGSFSFTDDDMGQAITYYYSINGGTLWEPIPLDGDLRHVIMDSNGPGIKFRAVLETGDPMVTPGISEFNIQYVATNPIISLEGVWSKPQVEGGEITRLTVFFNNTAQSTSTSVWLTTYLDPNLLYISDGADGLSTFHSQEWDNATGIYRYHFKDVVQGNYSFGIDTEARAGLDDMTHLSTIIAIEYQDPLSNRVESFLTDFTNMIISPNFNIEIISDLDTADVGDALHFQILINNDGGGTSPVSWMNETQDERFEYLNSSGGICDGTNFTWQIGAIPGGANRTLHLNVSLRDNAIQNANVPLRVSINYTDSSGYMRSTTSQKDILCQLRSGFTSDMVSQASHLRPGDSFVVTVYYNNTLYGAATIVNILVDVPEGLDVESSSATWMIDHGSHAWTFT
ncbi:MAG: hypothetical protein KAS16_00715, partial [Thermoplasmata archaeon]|nr:hypothetical protein [Thermoplasmata archaeon]